MTASGTSSLSRMQHSTAFERAARAGHAVSGVLHLLIGWITIRLAFGQGGNADQSGALAELASKPGGRAALWVAVVAFVALALWRVTEAVVGKKRDSGSDTGDRLKAAALAVVYLAFAWSAFGFARGSGRSSGEQNAGITARLMQSTPGKGVLLIAAAVIVGVGVYHVYKGVSTNFRDDLDGPVGRGVTWLGIAGYTAKGLALAGAGLLVAVSVFTSDPSKSTGLDGAVKTLGAQPYGQVLLVLAGLGIGLYGLYAFVLARRATM
ncbi:DUF1206 domain-containing protein [Rhodococcoides corynebacterioides]|uniref:DUF1206 domain-containing protein n=1 Tax=Rhodococcoides corynebacterioides TaxID=53972 RepID=UPI001C9B56F9|nr:DUF1206 domain-containing protein [Rhodococcus corynebacterioides]MBY6348810.1 DUF1206 domain-containing protein [Rhodococcus corynebacterioides]